MMISKTTATCRGIVMYDKVYLMSVLLLVYDMTPKITTVLEITEVALSLFNKGTLDYFSTEHSVK